MFPFIRPTMPEPREWQHYLAPAYQHRRFTNFGPVHDMLERRITEQLCPPGRVAVLTSSGTAALTAALIAWDVRGKVLLPSFTFPATLQAVLQAQCEPVFCDVSPQTWEAGLEEVLPCLGRGVQAVIGVRSFGLCRDFSSLARACSRYSIPLVLDSAAALGGTLAGGQRVGGQGAIEVFSLHATKVFGIGEGGVLFTAADQADRVKQTINFGIRGDTIASGFNGKLSEFAAAVGLAVLDRFDDFLSVRRARSARYYEFFRDFPGCACASDPGDPPWQTFPVRLPEAIDAGDFVTRTREAGLELRRYYRPALNDDPVAKQLANSMVCWPVYSDMSSEEQESILTITRGLLDPA
jgi:dTDP-4-amino-4,6-dideoxygalactose transaminase